MLNIPSTINDPKYRYRMPKMQVKIQSKGNGIKTNIVNLGDVAKHLRTNQQYILKWFGSEKASQTTFKQAGGKNNTNYIINGEFGEEDLRKVLDKFIQKYILCPKCKLPEMHMQVEGDKINGKCDSCPFVGQLDNKHKIASYVIKNPPLPKNMATGKVVKNEEKSATTATQSKNNDKKQQKKQQIQNVVTFNVQEMDFGSEQFNKFGQYIKIYHQSLKQQDFDIRSAKIVAKLKPYGLKKPLLAYIIFNMFFTTNINNQIAEHSKIYLNLVKKLIQNNTQLETLLNIQYLFLEANKDKDFSKYLPTILYNVVKQNLISQELLTQWNKNQIPQIQKNFLFNSARDAEFKKIVTPYLESLQDQDEETS